MILSFKYFFNLTLILLTFGPPFLPSYALNINKENKENIKSIYILGPGDQILFRIFNFENFNSKVTILSDGTVTLPRVGSVYLTGLSLKDARKSIKDIYSKVIKKPVIYLDLIKQRPLKISITGEVQIPGIYSLMENQTNQLSNTDGGENFQITSSGYPTLIEAIQKAGGITLDGDLSKIKISRLNHLNKNIETININYWEAINKNESFNKLILFDGDNIFIPKKISKSNQELISISSSNLSPSTVTVNIIGEVVNPGSLQVKANTSLMQSILSAGGLSKTSNKNKILLIRLENDGSIYKKKYKYLESNFLNKDFNPPIRDGDIVFVDRNNWTKSVDSLKTIVSPISPIINAATLYRIISQ
jgi:polysaccharide export outer membrane protein